MSRRVPGPAVTEVLGTQQRPRRTQFGFILVFKNVVLSRPGCFVMGKSRLVEQLVFESSARIRVSACVLGVCVYWFGRSSVSMYLAVCLTYWECP